MFLGTSQNILAKSYQSLEVSNMFKTIVEVLESWINDFGSNLFLEVFLRNFLDIHLNYYVFGTKFFNEKFLPYSQECPKNIHSLEGLQI